MAASPIALGFKDPSFIAAAAQYVYVGEADAWHDLESGQLLNRRSLDGLLAHSIARGPSTQLLGWQRTAKVHGISFRPGERQRIFREGARWRLNTWTPVALTPQEGDWPLVRALLNHLFPVDAQRDHVLDVLGHLVQQPASKVRHALVLTGVPGCGKSTFAKLVAALVGDENSNTIDGHVLTGRWLNPLVDCVLLTIEEVVHGSRFEVTDKLKTLVTEPTIKVEAKHRDFFSARTPDLVIVLSNDERPLALGEGSRREWMPDFVGGRLDDRYYAALHDALASEIPHLLHALLLRDVKAFNPSAPPPMTDAKASAIADSRPSLVAQVEEMLAAGERPFDKDVVLPADVACGLRAAGFACNDNQVRKALRSVGGEAVGQMPPSHRWVGRPRVWAMRNHEHWKEAGVAAVREYLLTSSSTAGHFAPAAQPVLRALP